MANCWRLWSVDILATLNGRTRNRLVLFCDSRRNLWRTYISYTQPFAFRLFLLTRSLVVVALYKKMRAFARIKRSLARSQYYFILFDWWLPLLGKPGVHYDIVAVYSGEISAEAYRPRNWTETGRRGTTRSAIAGVVYTTTFGSFPCCFHREGINALLL